MRGIWGFKMTRLKVSCEQWVAKWALVHAIIGVGIGVAMVPGLVGCVVWMVAWGGRPFWFTIGEYYAIFFGRVYMPMLSLVLGGAIAFPLEYGRLSQWRFELLKSERRCTACSYPLPEGNEVQCPECGCGVRNRGGA
jgi:hypothetical protein